MPVPSRTDQAIDLFDAEGPNLPPLVVEFADNLAACDDRAMKRWKYDGFISYSTQAAGDLAPKLQDALEQCVAPNPCRRQVSAARDARRDHRQHEPPRPSTHQPLTEYWVPFFQARSFASKLVSWLFHLRTVPE
jgi:hypothetical protein